MYREQDLLKHVLEDGWSPERAIARASTAQQITIALALERPDLLPAFCKDDEALAWGHLDGAQRAIVRRTRARSQP